jgi:hypothetical protein
MEWAFSGSILESGDLNSTVSDSVEVRPKELVDLEFAATAETKFRVCGYWSIISYDSKCPLVHQLHPSCCGYPSCRWQDCPLCWNWHFQPHDFNNKPLQTVLISKVLHVPSLTSSLISPLHLTQHHGFKVIMEAKHTQFVQDNQLRLCASTTGNRNLAYVNGTVIINPSDVASEFAQAATSFATLPLDMSLWHRRLGHIGVRNVQSVRGNDSSHHGLYFLLL